MKIVEYLRYVFVYVEALDIPKLLFAKMLRKKEIKFKLKNGGYCFRLFGLESFRCLSKVKYKKEFDTNQFCWSFGNKSICCTPDQLEECYSEYIVGEFEDWYGNDFRGKSVLDIGGYVGDSAKFFFENGADKVTIYEPIKQNFSCIYQNLIPYKDKYRLYDKFIYDRECEMIISSDYPTWSMAFGLRKGRHKTKVSCVSIESVLNKKYDIIKMDCEGCEYNLLNVSSKKLKTASPYWIIEFHNTSDPKFNMLVKEFLNAGFKLIREISVDKEVKILHLKMNRSTTKKS